MSNRTNRTICLTLSILILSMLHATAGAKIIYVDHDAAGANNGTSWQNAYTFLQEALADAERAEKPVEIRVAQGTYKPNEGLVAIPEFDWRTTTFRLVNGVTLKSGYAGLGAPDPNARDIGLYETILNGDLNGDDADVARPPTRTDNSYHVVTSSGTDETAVLDGFTITGGFANGTGLETMGGGIYWGNESSGIIENCTIVANESIQGGGGVFCDLNSHPVIRSCTISRNSSQDGGGIDCFDESYPIIEYCTIQSNITTGDGAGIYCDVNSCPLIAYCTISDNSADDGGGIDCWMSRPIIEHCFIVGNVALSEGGAIEYDTCFDVTIRNCTIMGNRAIIGGGICYDESHGEIVNSIIWRNIANDGPSIALESWPWAGASFVTVTYSDIWYGLGSVLIQPDCVLHWGDGNIDSDPLFADPENGDYHLKSQTGRWDPVSESWVVDDVKSPCIDAGDPNSPVGEEPEPNGGIINMGAYGGTAEASMSPVGVEQIVYIQWLGHASVKVWTEDGIVYVDPQRLSISPHDATLVCVTHTHGDHYSPTDISRVSNAQTQFIGPPDVVQQYGSGQTIAPGQTFEFGFVSVKAVPAYNTNKSNHPRSNNWVGYILELGGRRIYVAGDTDLIEEMKSLRKIDVAFLPAGGTYTMNAVEAAQATQYIKPKLAIPYHWGQIVGTLADAQRFAELARCAVKILEVGETIGSDEWPVYQPLVAHWTLDEAEGDIAHDTIGEHDGVLSGDPAWMPTGGKIDGALQFDGVDDYVNAPFVLDPAEGVLSAFAWIKGGRPGQTMLSQTNAGGQTWLGADPVQGNLISGLTPPPAGRTVTPALGSQQVITDGQWHHVGFVWDGQYRHLYADGVEAAADTSTISPLTSSSGGMFIGAGGNLDTANFWSGLIDDMRIYNQALDAEEVEALAR